MSVVRRSSHLANVHPMNVVQKAQRNLCRKLGLLIDDDIQPVERALQEYLAIYSGVLLEDIIAAFSAVFNPEDDALEDTDNAMVAMLGDGVGELDDLAAMPVA